MSESVWTGKRVLVTGGYGFVASHIIERLVGAGAHCFTIAVERPSQAYLTRQGLESQITVALADIADAGSVRRVLNEHEVEVVFHLAAQAIVGAAMRSPLSTLESNVRGTYVLLEECRLQWSEGEGGLRAVVVASSDKAYGEQPSLPYTEAQPLGGINLYDASKACADILSRCYHHSYGLPVAVTRCANIYGPGDLNFSRIIPSVMRDLFNGRRPLIRSDGSPVRDYMYVSDAADGYLTLAEAVMAGVGVGEALNFGTGDPVSVLDLTQEIVEVAGKPDLEPDVRGEAAGEISRQYIDASKADSMLGWRARTARREGLQTTWEWYAAYLASGETSQ
jgi:CDP-glucose 4,6-dehydratase